MKKTGIFLFAFSAMLISAGSAFGGDMEVFYLKNNIRVLFDKTDGAKVFALRVFSPVSALCETPETAGLSNLTAKVMAKSTINRSNEVLAKDTENIGASLSCDADYDYANVTISCMSDYFAKAAEIMSDVVVNPAFNENEIASEKKNIIAGLNSRRDSIWLTAMDNFTKLYYKDAPYALPVQGSEKTVNAVNRDTLVQWHKFTYNASNIIIVVSGNLDKETVKKTLEKYFGAIEQGTKFDKPVFDAVMPDDVVTIKAKFNQAYIVKGFAAPALKEKDFVTLKVIGSVLGGRMTSRMFIELREKLGLAYEVSTVFPSRVNPSFFVIYIGLDKKNIALTQKRMGEILKEFCAKEMDEQELKDVKSYMKGLYIMDRQTVLKKSYYYGWREVTGQGYEYDRKFLEDIDAVTTKDIYETANRIFNTPSLTVILTSDEK